MPFLWLMVVNSRSLPHKKNSTLPILTNMRKKKKKSTNTKLFLNIDTLWGNSGISSLFIAPDVLIAKDVSQTFPERDPERDQFFVMLLPRLKTAALEESQILFPSKKIGSSTSNDEILDDSWILDHQNSPWNLHLKKRSGHQKAIMLPTLKFQKWGSIKLEPYWWKKSCTTWHM